MGAPYSCIITFFHDFWSAQRSPKQPKIHKNRHQFLSFFWMRPGRPPGGFWKPKCCPNHQKSLRKWIRKRQLTPSKKAKISTGKTNGKKHGKQLLKQKRSKGRTLKMLIFHWFLRYNMHVRILHTLSKLKLARARRSLKTT